MKPVSVIMASVVLLLVGASVHAQQPLDRGTINRWADSMEEVQRWGESRIDLDGDASMDFAASFARAAREHAEVQRIIARHGFSSGDQWARTGSRIMHAFAAMKMDAYAPAMEREMRQQLEEIERNPHLPPEQRQMMRQQIELAMGSAEAFADAPAEDVAAVRANRQRLDRLFEDG
ncbi:MAG: hypothetical protein EA384_11490 [Spirochaetaceae bacterium]|nr:MAG: hypothetical protein EA384_11490 [Spirochaetaceae bacterium]